MERREYEATYEREEDYWWFKGQRAIIGDLLQRYRARAGGRLLDAGCGTGGDLESMALGGWPAAVGFEVSP